MVTPLVHPVGQDALNVGAGDFALMRTGWSGMVTHYLDSQTPFDGVLTTKPALPGQTGEDFQYWGRAKTHNWKKGTSLIRDTAANGDAYPSNIQRTSKRILLDRPAVATEPIDNWEAFMSDPDEQRNVAVALASAAHQEYHYRQMSVMLASAEIALDPLGNAIPHPAACVGMGVAPSASAIKAAISAAKVALELRGYTSGKITAILRLEDYVTFLESEPNAINKDYTSGNNGGIDIGKVYNYMGVAVQSTNAFTRLPDNAANDPASIRNDPWGTGNGYDFTVANYRGVVFHEGAGGILEKSGISSHVIDGREEYGMITPVVQFTAGLSHLSTDAAIPLKVA